MEEAHRRALADVHQGMRLATDVTVASGQRLAVAGAEVTARLLEQLAGHGITHLDVFVDVVMDEAQRQELRKEIEARLGRRFAGVMDQPLMAELYKAILTFRTRGL